MLVHAFAALRPGQKLVPFQYETGPLKGYEVLIRVEYCGVCHSDIHLIDDDWKRSVYPLVPGHEVVGSIVEVGDEVEGVRVGQKVGVSWVKSSCLHCSSCLAGDTSICADKQLACVGNYGGFADYMVADSRFVYPIPKGMELAYAAPLLCAGATVYAPMRRFGIGPESRVAVIGIGGLGHLALQFAKAFGAEVTAISHSKDKEREARGFGADHYLTEIPTTSHFDFILSTVQADLDWNRCIQSLNPKGILCFVGRVQNPATIDLSPLISFQKTITGSSTASRAILQEMLLVAAQKQIRPKIEIVPLSEINDAIQKVKANQARYRMVVDNSRSL